MISRQKRPDSAPSRLFWVALAVRLAYVVLAHMYRIRPYLDHFSFGWEMGRIGRALVTGYGFADPFHGHTGPTTWVGPAYPLIIAAVFKLFGIYTARSAFVLLALNCVLNALMVRFVWEIAARCFNNLSVTRWSAWLWALYPAAMQYAVKWIWEMTLTAFLFAWVLTLSLRMRNIGGTPEEAATAASPRRWLLFALLWGLIALSNPSLLLFLPVNGAWIVAGYRNQRGGPGAQFANAMLATVVFLACVAPWTYRNWRAFHHFIPMRGNFGVEFYLGNGPQSTGLLMAYDHPAQDPIELEHYRRMGELAYAKWRGELAKAYIRKDPVHFLNLCLRRLYFFWFGVPHPFDEGPLDEYGRLLNFQFTSIVGLLGLALALKRRVPAAGLFTWAFVLLPLVYYLVTVHARFRHPLEPLMTIFAVYLFHSAEKSWRVRWVAG